MKQNALHILKGLTAISPQEPGSVTSSHATPEFEDERKDITCVSLQPASDLGDWPRLAQEARGLAWVRRPRRPDSLPSSVSSTAY